ncbi:rasGTPase-activating protein [Naegleria gruberi]|uniref:RasGTPase-activating protein n=1 Tax=Naegleria gruberi TaxID=5762 RepID=D2VDW9_NAEGR|nr:rasGTPase-activating protein [Naegleria gruberi]EFC45070.1 rasGTPase-activating protein [Naegleria gruberi]|eukprot:XP_002677814.1 rasGTPase-activating protein [Naegleria gruberi strain NEG-M]
MSVDSIQQEKHTNYIPPPPTSSVAVLSRTFSVKSLQSFLKKEGKAIEDETSKDVDKLTELKKNLVLEAKQNWVIEQQVEILGNKIRLLIKNHVQAEDMKKLLDSSFEKVKMKTRDDAQGFRDEAIAIYQKIFYIFRKDPKYLAILTRLIRGKEVDTFLQTVVFTLFGDQFDEREEHLLLMLFERVLAKEYQTCSYIGEFMRSNTAFTKMLGTMLRRTMYHKFLLKVLKEPIEQVINDKTLNMEINSHKIYQQLVQKALQEGKSWDGPMNATEEEAENDERVIEIIKPRVQKIIESVEQFLVRIFQSVDETPYGVRFMCKRILQYGKETYNNATETEIYSLCGGLIFLRWVNPAITTCDSDQSNIIQEKLTTNQRKSLTMICKVIQNLSNGIPFGAKEKYMIPLNVIIEKYTKQMHEYMKRMCDIDEIAEKLELAEIFELSGDVGAVNISYNEVALIHRLCFENIDTITSPMYNSEKKEITTPANTGGARLTIESSSESAQPSKTEFDELLYKFIQQLNKFGPPPEALSPKNNYYFNLKLKNPTQIIELNDSLANNSTLKKNVKDLISTVLRDLPSLPKDDITYSISDVLLAGETLCNERQNSEFAKRIGVAIDQLKLLQDQITEEEQKEFDTMLVKEIFEELETKKLMRKTLKKKIEVLTSVLSDINEKREYLKTQLDMYNTYFTNTLSKTFKPTDSSDKGSVGPFTFKFSDLEKKGVIANTTLSSTLKKMVKIQISSTKPGIFVVVVNATGIVAIKSELDLNELLEKQANEENNLDFDSVTLSVPMLIHLLNKLFVLGDHTKKGSKSMKRRTESVATSTTSLN